MPAQGSSPASTILRNTSPRASRPGRRLGESCSPPRHPPKKEVVVARTVLRQALADSGGGSTGAAGAGGRGGPSPASGTRAWAAAAPPLAPLASCSGLADLAVVPVGSPRALRPSFPSPGSRSPRSPLHGWADSGMFTGSWLIAPDRCGWTAGHHLGPWPIGAIERSRPSRKSKDLVVAVCLRPGGVDHVDPCSAMYSTDRLDLLLVVAEPA